LPSDDEETQYVSNLHNVLDIQPVLSHNAILSGDGLLSESILHDNSFPGHSVLPSRYDLLDNIDNLPINPYENQVLADEMEIEATRGEKKIKKTTVTGNMKEDAMEEEIIYHKINLNNDLDKNEKNQTPKESVEYSGEIYKLSKSKPQHQLIGSIILPVDNLMNFLSEFAHHCIECCFKPVFSRDYRCGLFIRFTYRCYKCQKEIFLSTSKQVFQKRLGIFAINMCSVLGSLSTGLGYAAMNEIFSIIDVKFISESQYKKINSSFLKL